MITSKDNLIIICLCTLSSFVIGYREQKFAMEPQDQTAVVGSRVTLPCRVTDKSGILQWTKDDFGLGTHRNLSGFDRYTMIGSDEEGDFSLDIYPVMLDDDARYQCQVSPGPLGQPGIRSKFATLTVYVPPDPPRIVQGKHLITTEDREIELECISYGGKPAAEITWIDGHGNVLTDGMEYIVEELSDGRRFTAKSILKLTPKKEHHNTTFTCQAQNTAERTHRSAKLSLEVKYAPKVTVSIASETSSNGRILEGGDVRLRCNADANPPDLTYRWFLNDELIVGDYTTELLLHNVTRKYHDSMVKCEVHNPVGKSEESETLDISYAPYFRNKPKSVEADLGSTKTITCDVDGNPLPEMTWIKEDTNEVVSNNPNLTIKVDRKTAGRYVCKAHIPGFADVEASAAIYLKGPPNIISRRTQFGIEGDNVRVECTAYSVPAADHVIWTFNGKEVDVHDQDFSVLEDPIPEGIKSTLIIRESQGRHFGNYNCTVSNAYGTDVVEINLIPQITVSENFPILIVIVGVVGAIIVLVIVVMIVFLCQRQGNKKSQPDEGNNTMEKQCKESDRSSNISDLKIDLRTGSSVSNVHCDDYVPGIESETGSESVITRIGVPLAGPVAISNQDIYRYSADYTDANFASKDGQNNNGYVPYVDYSRDYNPPMPQPPAMETSESLQSRALQLNAMQAPHYTISSTITLNDLNSSSIPNGHTTMGGSIDPRYSAAYGNPYLRSSSIGLPTPNTANPVATPAPPPYSRDTSSSSSRNLVNCSSAAMNICAAANGGVAVSAAAPQLTRLPNSPTNHQYIVSNANITTTKRGALATHV